MIQKMLRPFVNRLQRMIGRAVIKLVDDTMRMQAVQISLMADETRHVERVQDYGFTSHPHPGAEAVALFLGGMREHGLVIKVDDPRYRLRNLQPGEAALYDDQDQTIVLKRDRIEVTSPKAISVTAPKVVVNSENVHLGGAEGGKRVAREDDFVRIGSGSSAGDWPIVSGSDTVRAT